MKNRIVLFENSEQKINLIMDNCEVYSTNSRSFPDRELQNKSDISYAVLYIRIIDKNKSLLKKFKLSD